jgi:hypothetical protein
METKSLDIPVGTYIGYYLQRPLLIKIIVKKINHCLKLGKISLSKKIIRPSPKTFGF